MKRRIADWDFHYRPSQTQEATDEASPVDVVVATSVDVSPARIGEALRDLGPTLRVERLLARAPLFWSRVRSPVEATRTEVAAALARASVPVRYVASALRGSMVVPPPLDMTEAPAATATDWRTNRARPVPLTSVEGGHWFLGAAGGIRVDRRVCGTGAGMRLAVIEDDAADFEHLDLDRIVPVGVESIPCASGHGALMVGWAVGARRPDGTRYVGVAPDASVRAYCPPKPGADVVSLPLALARAVFDGADVIACATYVEGTTTPMLDDALDVASRLGRRGRGTAVVLPTGRETSSPPGSLHASLSLGLGDPASDPRVQCIAPGGRQGGWFLWRASSRSKLRPFSNRGPAVRWLAPGDDVAHPFSSRDRLFHAESSGASAMAAGVMLLVLASNQGLRLHEMHALLARTVDAPDRCEVMTSLVADPVDLLPFGPDRDGHNARVGYGRLNATRACAAASDPVALGLSALGEDEQATAWGLRLRHPYSPRLGRWAVRALLARPDIEHALRVVLRHARLVSSEHDRAAAHASGAVVRHLSTIVRELARSRRAPPLVAEELRRAIDALQTASGAPIAVEADVLSLFEAPGPAPADARSSHESPAFSASPMHL